MPDFKYMLQGKYADAFKAVPQLRLLLVQLYFVAQEVADRNGIEVEDLVVTDARMETSTVAGFKLVPNASLSKILGPDGNRIHA